MFESLSVEGTTLSSARITCHFSHCGDRPAASNDLGSSKRKDGKLPPLNAILNESVDCKAFSKDAWIKGNSAWGIDSFVSHTLEEMSLFSVCFEEGHCYSSGDWKFSKVCFYRTIVLTSSRRKYKSSLTLTKYPMETLLFLKWFSLVSHLSRK